MQGHDDPEISAALKDAERAGFRLMLFGHTAILAVTAAGFTYGYWLYGNASGLILTLLSLGLGILILCSLGTRFERSWHRYVLVAADVLLLTAAALFLPLTTGGDVPRIFVFRTYGIHFLWVVLVVSALALSPRLILFTGAALIAALWTVFLAATRAMDRTLSWSDLPRGSTPEEYVRLILHPSFIGTGNRVEECVALLAATLVLALAVHRARRVVAAFALEEKRRLQAERVFGRYVPESVAAQILETPEALRPNVQEGTVLYLDVEGFTAYAARQTPDVVLDRLSRLLSLVSEKIVGAGGIVIGFGGDSVLATFGVPIRLPNHAGQAIDAARDILQDLAPEGGPDALQVRIGLATGPIAAGIVGSAHRQSYTVYGATVNLAQRLEQANKAFGTRLLACEATVRARPSPHGLRPLGPVTLQGFADPVAVFGS